eukprot:NODE_89_length_21781_cov_0.895836.p13 type:complete len:205 gc:universal NODE_89_length_21781_cov_0.895836:5564-4950(-)
MLFNLLLLFAALWDDGKIDLSIEIKNSNDLIENIYYFCQITKDKPVSQTEWDYFYLNKERHKITGMKEPEIIDLLSKNIDKNDKLTISYKHGSQIELQVGEKIDLLAIILLQVFNTAKQIDTAQSEVDNAQSEEDNAQFEVNAVRNLIDIMKTFNLDIALIKFGSEEPPSKKRKATKEPIEQHIKKPFLPQRPTRNKRPVVKFE